MILNRSTNSYDSTSLTGQHKDIYDVLTSNYIIDGISMTYPSIYLTMLPLIVHDYTYHPERKFVCVLREPTYITNTWQKMLDKLTMYYNDIDSVNTNPKGIVIVKLHRNTIMKDIKNWENDHRIATAVLTIDQTTHIRLHKIGELLFVITNKYSSEFFNRIMTVMPAFFPEYKEDVELMELIQTFTTGNVGKFAELSEKYLTKYTADILQNIVKQNWKNLFKQQFDERINLLKENINRYNDTLEEYYSNVQDYLEYLRNTTIELNALQQMDTSLPEETLQYIMGIKGIVNTSFVPGSSIVTLTFSVPCRNYDVDLVQTLVNSTREDSFWRANKKYISPIFLEERYTFYLGAMLDVDFLRFKVARAQRYREAIYKIGIPSHHFYEFDCFGMNKAPLMEALKNKDYVYFFTHLLNTAGGLNFNESSRVEVMFYYAMDEQAPWNKPCVKDNVTGVFYTWKEYMGVINNEIHETDREGQVVPETTTDTTT